MLDAGAWTRDADPVVSGPYKFSSWTSNNSITLVKNEKYYDAENVRISEIKIYFGNREENTAAFAAGGFRLLILYRHLMKKHKAAAGTLR